MLHCSFVVLFPSQRKQRGANSKAVLERTARVRVRRFHNRMTAKKVSLNRPKHFLCAVKRGIDATIIIRPLLLICSLLELGDICKTASQNRRMAEREKCHKSLLFIIWRGRLSFRGSLLFLFLAIGEGGMIYHALPEGKKESFSSHSLDTTV